MRRSLPGLVLAGFALTAAIACSNGSSTNGTPPGTTPTDAGGGGADGSTLSPDATVGDGGMPEDAAIVDSGPVITDAVVTDEERLPALSRMLTIQEEIEQKEPDAKVAATKMVEQIAKLGPVAEVTVANDFVSVIGRFKDGRWFSLARNRPIARPPAGAPGMGGSDPGPYFSKIPSGKQFRIAQMADSGYGTEVGDKVAKMLTSPGINFKDASAPGRDARVASLRNLFGDSVFLLNVHGTGGELKSKVKVGAYWTSSYVTDGKGAPLRCIPNKRPTDAEDPGGIGTTPAERCAGIDDLPAMGASVSDNFPDIKADLAAERLGYMGARYTGTNLAGESTQFAGWAYAITPAFVTHYMSFKPNSLIYLLVCHSHDEPTMRDAFKSVGAGVLYSYEGLAIPWDANLAAVRFFDHLLGLNSLVVASTPFESPPQRSFDDGLVFADLRSRKLLETTAALSFLKRDEYSGPTLLRPSIERIVMGLFGGTIDIYGSFGDRAGAVTVDGTTLTSCTWGSTKINCNLPENGAGSAGPVVVSVDGIESHPVNITQWEVEIAFDQNDPAPSTSKRNITWKFKLRADVHPYRTKPHAAPVEQKLSGLWHDAKGPLSTWTTSGHVSSTSGDCPLTGTGFLGPTDPSKGPTYTVKGTFDGALSEFLLDPSATGTKYTMTCPGAPPSTTEIYNVGYAFLAYGGKAGLPVQLDANYDIKPDNFVYKPDGIPVFSYAWKSTAKVRFPPGKDDPR